MGTLALVNAAIALLDTLVPKIADMVESGEITVAEQADVAKRYAALKANMDTHFTGPEWEQSGVK